MNGGKTVRYRKSLSERAPLASQRRHSHPIVSIVTLTDLFKSSIHSSRDDDKDNSSVMFHNETNGHWGQFAYLFFIAASS